MKEYAMRKRRFVYSEIIIDLNSKGWKNCGHNHTSEKITPNRETWIRFFVHNADLQFDLQIHLIGGNNSQFSLATCENKIGQTKMKSISNNWLLLIVSLNTSARDVFIATAKTWPESEMILFLEVSDFIYYKLVAGVWFHPISHRVISRWRMFIKSFCQYLFILFKGVGDNIWRFRLRTYDSDLPKKTFL
jgi:hypothetical protein